MNRRRTLRQERRTMQDPLTTLLEAAKKIRMTPAQREQQRRSFAYGNAKIENELITRETVDRQAEDLESQDGNRRR